MRSGSLQSSFSGELRTLFEGGRGNICFLSKGKSTFISAVRSIRGGRFSVTVRTSVTNDVEQRYKLE